MTYRMIQIGLGAMGGEWCETALPPNIEEGLLEVVAAVDINPEALIYAQQTLGLRADQCYTDLQKALDQNRADFCTIVVTPAHHEAVVDLALAHDLHILSEKPIADTLAASVRIADKVKRAGVKMGVTMSHRFDQDKTTLRRELRSDRYGTLDYLVCHLTADLRKYGSWGVFRHEIADPLMIEGAVHHLDFLADMAGAKVRYHLCANLESALGRIRRGFASAGYDGLRKRQPGVFRGRQHQCRGLERLGA